MTLPGSTSLQVGQPRYFGFPAVLLANLFAVAVGGVGLLPLAVLPLAFTLNLPPLLFAVLAFFDLVTVLAVMLMLFPVMLANPFVILLLRLSRQRPPDPGEFVCQVMITPRLQRGLRAAIYNSGRTGWFSPATMCSWRCRAPASPPCAIPTPAGAAYGCAVAASAWSPAPFRVIPRWSSSNGSHGMSSARNSSPANCWPSFLPGYPDLLA